MLFTAVDVGRKSQLPLLTKLVDVVESGSSSLPDLNRVIVIRGENPFPSTFSTYEDVLGEASLPHTRKIVDDLTKSVDCHEVCNFQFTSGTTGEPKATTLTH
jgi:mevalonyl-CoA ligase